MIRTRNLVCHILPRTAGQKWRATVEHLRRRWRLFNGKRIIAVATADDCDSPDDVKEAFGDDSESIEWITFKNNPVLREVISFVPMLGRVASLDPNEATFICHGKGATHAHDDSVCHLWRDVMFEVCGTWPLVECALKDHAVCGAFRTVAGHLQVPFHFSGTFYWIRHDRTFARDWPYIPQHYAGTEAWPGVQFKFEESQCLFMDNTPSPYDEQAWLTTILPAYRYWQDQLRAHGVYTTDCSPPSWLTQRVNHSLPQTGRDGSAMTAPEKRSSPRTLDSLRHAFGFSKK
jgi:hypothetical protein